MNAPKRSVLIRDLGFGLLAIIVVAAASVVPQVATYPNLAPWYAGLVKPSFNPPNWVFGPVWTTLYLMMAFVVWRILRLPEASAERRWALGLFIAQLALNAAWSWMFFAANNPLLGLINIVRHPRNDRSFLSTRQDGRLVPCAAGGMGFLRDHSEFRYLDSEPLARLWVHLKYLNQQTAITALAHGTRNCPAYTTKFGCLLG
jgi:TspO/MBR family